jgi:dTMP kinase
MFITFEGGEGSGKTTVIKKLAAKLTARGYEVVVTREPGGSKLGEHIRDCVLNPDFGIAFGDKAELMLFLAARAQHIEEVIKPALSKGKIVLCDRFNDSSVAYQGGGRGLGIDKVQQICDLICDSFTPDLTFFLDLDPKTGMSRIRRAKDRMEEESLAFHQKVRKAFQQLAKQNPNRIHIIDADQSGHAVFSEVLHFLSLSKIN